MGVQLSNYIDQFLVRRVYLGLFGCPSLHSVVYSDYRFTWVHINVDKTKPRNGGYWNFNLNVKDFRDQLNIVQTDSMFGNKWRGHFKHTIRSFATDYSRQLNLDILATQNILKSRIYGTVKLGDNDKVVIAKVVLA